MTRDTSGDELRRHLELLATAGRGLLNCARIVIDHPFGNIGGDPPLSPQAIAALRAAAARAGRRDASPIMLPRGDWALASPLPDAPGGLYAIFDAKAAAGVEQRKLLVELAALVGARVSAAQFVTLPDTVMSLARLTCFQLERATGRVKWLPAVGGSFGPSIFRPPTLNAALASVSPEAQAKLRAEIAEGWETGAEINVSTTMAARDGTTRDVVIRLRAEGGMDGGAAAIMSGIVLDVTDARSFDERLQREKDLLQTTLDHMDQALLVIEQDMTVSVLSKRLTKLLRLPPQFADNPPSFPEIIAFQHETGLVSEEELYSPINRLILERGSLSETDVLEQDTSDGRTIEIRTSQLPSGAYVRTFTDTTSRRSHYLEIARAQEEYRALFENSIVGLYRSSLDGKPQRANPALVKLNGYETEKELLQGLSDPAKPWYVERERRQEFMKALRERGRVDDFLSEVYRHKTRERIWVSESAWQIHDASGAVTAFEGTVVDATERKRAEEKIAYMARHDGLTGLANRHALHEQLEEALELGDPKEPVALLYIDLDRFKTVNDTLGHSAGDDLLIELGRRFSETVGDEGTVARFGGDEFTILLRAADREVADKMAIELIEAANQPILLEGRKIEVGVSIGIAIAPDHGVKVTQVLRAADLALYRAKREGRNRRRFYTPAMDDDVHSRRSLELDLRYAAAADELHVLYQPIVEMATGGRIGHEALLRWSHPELGPISPERFVAIAEETGFINQIGQWVLHRSCEDAARSRDLGRVGVNVSPVQLVQPDFAGKLWSLLDNTRLDPSRLVIEVTESTLMASESSAADILRSLRRGGVKTALDDFGTGYSSLGYLGRFEFDIIKLDRSFIARINEREIAAVVSSVVKLGRELNVQMIVEGIETQAHFDAARKLGCAFGQGHFFGEPKALESDDLRQVIVP